MTTHYTADLHTHTYYSDARFSPEELVRVAARIGLKTLAITDHDNTRGGREAQPIAAALGIELIPAVELTTRWDGFGWPRWGNCTDVLGYFIDWDTPAFQTLAQGILEEYIAELGTTFKGMTAAGLPVTLEEVFAENPRYPSMFQMLAVLEKKGLLHDQSAVVDLFAREWSKARGAKAPIERVIETIHAAGGAAVLAHPVVVYGGDGEWIKEKDLAQLVEIGLDGIEVYHYRLADQDARTYFLNLAAPFDLAITGGSDEHGWPEGFRRLGGQPVTGEMVEVLRERARQRRAASGRRSHT